MKAVTLIILTILLSSCGSDGDQAVVPDAVPCASTKSIESVWTLRSDGTIFDMRACPLDSICEVKFGAGACSDGRGDFTLYVDSNGEIEMGDCALNLIDLGEWAISCENILSLTGWQSGDPDDTLD